MRSASVWALRQLPGQRRRVRPRRGCSLAGPWHEVCRNASTNHDLQLELLAGETARW